MTPTPEWHELSDTSLGILNGIIHLVPFLVIVAAMIGIGAYFSRRTRHGSELAKQLGFELGSAALHTNVDAFPLNVEGGLFGESQMSANGWWRGRRAESVLLYPGAKASMVAEFRVELVEIDEYLPRVEFLSRRRDSIVPTGGGNVVDVESDDFNQAFDVIASNPAYAHAVLQPRMMERLLRADVGDASVTVCGNRVFCWRPAIEGVLGARARLDLISDVADLLPPFLVELYGESPLPSAADATDASAPASRTTRNWMAWAGWACLVTLVLWPVGILFGHLALRAARAGTATNARSARVLLYVGYLVPALAVLLFACAPTTATVA